MAKFELKFIDELDSSLSAEIKQVVYKIKGESKKFIDIEIEDNESHVCCFTMDKSSAIKFAKTLRTEINKITESEGCNGETN